jgi:hypothetical protein
MSCRRLRASGPLATESDARVRRRSNRQGASGHPFKYRHARVRHLRRCWDRTRLRILNSSATQDSSADVLAPLVRARGDASDRHRAALLVAIENASGFTPVANADSSTRARGVPMYCRASLIDAVGIVPHGARIALRRGTR